MTTTLCLSSGVDRHLFHRWEMRGQLRQPKLNHKLSKTVDGYVLIEDFVPGGFYDYFRLYNPMISAWARIWPIMAFSRTAFVVSGPRSGVVSRA